MAVEVLQAIVILGALVLPDGTASPTLERRVEYGVTVWQENQTAKLIMTGGKTSTASLSEAQTMAYLAQGLGVPETALILEEKARNTIENAALTAPILAELGAENIAVVTDFYHMPRALYVFGRQGIAIKPYPVWPDTWGVDQLSAMGREIFALLWTVARVEYAKFAATQDQAVR